MLILAEFLTGLFLFAVGACLGSFLNVVAYRWPRGMTLLGGSKCPYCKKPIPFYDNVPVLGWLFLRGRCRNCRLPISVRYPLIELLAGGMVLILGILELRFGAMNIPFAAHPRWGFAWSLFDPDWSLLGLFSGHLWVSLFLLTSALIEAQTVPRLPRMMLGSVAVAGVLMVVIWPSNLPAIALSGNGQLTAAHRPGQALLAAALGAVLGLLLGCLGTLLWAWLQRTRASIQVVAAWSVLGLFVGWQGMATIFMMFVICLIVTRSIRRRGLQRLSRQPLTLLFVTGMIQLLLWAVVWRVALWLAAFPLQIVLDKQLEI